MSALAQSCPNHLPLLELAIELRKLIGVFTSVKGEISLDPAAIGPVTVVDKLRIRPGLPGFGQSAPIIWSKKKPRSLDWVTCSHGHVREAQPDY